MTRVFSFVLLLAGLTGCATFVGEPDWPTQAYPRQYFEEIFQADEIVQQYQTQDDYLLWIIRFYNGYSITPGWLNLTEQVMERIDVSRHAAVAVQLYNLGGHIGSEWAKDNEVRRLDTRNAAVWRDALIESINQHELDEYITRVNDDIDRLMAGELDMDDIYFERYYIDEFDF